MEATEHAKPLGLSLSEVLGARSRSVTMAELLHPSEGSMVEFWCHRMSHQGKAGTGIRGWFRGGLFWSHDNADHYAPGEVAHWRGIRSALQCAARCCDGCLVCAPNVKLNPGPEGAQRRKGSV